jgi:hypothetical protein
MAPVYSKLTPLLCFPQKYCYLVSVKGHSHQALSYQSRLGHQRIVMFSTHRDSQADTPLAPSTRSHTNLQEQFLQTFPSSLISFHSATSLFRAHSHLCKHLPAYFCDTVPRSFSGTALPYEASPPKPVSARA